MRDRLFVHIVWTTRDRAPLVDAPTAGFLEHLFPITCRQERANLLALGMVQTHVHMLVRLHPTTQIPRLLQRLKGGSAVLAGREGLPLHGRPLRWAKGYGIASVSPQQLSSVFGYVRDQARRHPTEAIPGWPLDSEAESMGAL
jgi:putative transposase